MVTSSTSGSLGLTGWTAGTTYSVGTNLYAHLYWRVLQSGDAFSIPGAASTRRVAICATFAAGTFDPTSPVAEIAVASGTSNSATVGDSSNFAAGLHYRLMLGYAYGAGQAASYPYPYAQRLFQVYNGSNASTYAVASMSGDAFDGGVDPGSTIALTNTPPWVARKIVVRGKAA